MSILGRKLQSITESYTDYMDPAYESYNADCAGGILLQAEAYDDLNTIMEECYKVDCAELLHLNHVMALKENNASEGEIIDSRNEFEYVQEASIKEIGEKIGKSLKTLWEKVKNFIFSIGRNIRALFQSTDKVYETYKDRIAGKSIKIKGYEYHLNMTDSIKAVETLGERIAKVETMLDPQIQKGLSDQIANINQKDVHGGFRGFAKGQECVPKEIVIRGDEVGKKIKELANRDKVKETYGNIVTKFNGIVDEISNKQKSSTGEELTKLNKAHDLMTKLINGLNMNVSEYNKAASEANALYKKAIMGMVNGKKTVSTDAASNQAATGAEAAKATTATTALALRAGE